MSSDRRTNLELQAALADAQKQLEDLRLESENRLAAAVAAASTAPEGAMISSTPGERPIGDIAPQARLLNLKPPQIPSFCGEREETQQFVSAMNRALAAAGMMETLGGFHFATSHFSGSAQTWFLELSRRKPEIATWPVLRPLFEKEFEFVNAERVYESRLLALKQTGTAQSYVDDFRDLTRKASEFTDDFLQFRFTEGLCDFLKEKMCFLESPNVSELQRRTLVIAGRFPEQSTVHSGRNGMPLVAAVHGRKGGKHLDRKVGGGSNRHARQKTGRCHNCNQPGHYAYACPEKKQAVKTKGSFRPGKYDGSGRVGRVHAIEADQDSASDDELRSGNA